MVLFSHHQKRKRKKKKECTYLFKNLGKLIARKPPHRPPKRPQPLHVLLCITRRMRDRGMKRLYGDDDARLRFPPTNDFRSEARAERN